MSSKSIIAKKESLALAEAKIRHELEDVSELFETKTKNILIFSAIGGAVLLGAYGLYSFLGNKEQSPKPKKRKKSSYGIQKLLVEKATGAAINYISEELKKSFDKKKK
ncbi:MAG: hypothetical protein JXR10_11660 [Cyclobacteriaceae bacterium]